MPQLLRRILLQYSTGIVLCLVSALHIHGQAFQPRFISLQGSRNFDDINTILPDSKNFLWFGCSQGLVRFDGNTYQRFEPGIGYNTIASDAITALHEDKNGNIWIGSADKGLYRYTHQSDRFVSQPLPGTAAPVSSIETYGNGVAVCTGNAVFAIDNKTGTARKIALPDSFSSVTKIIKAVAGNDDQQLWMLCSTGVYSFDEKSGLLKQWHNHGFSTDEVGNLLTTLVLSGNNIYTATKNKGLVELNSATGKASQIGFSGSANTAYTSNNIDAIYLAENGALLAGTQDSGVAVFNIESHKFHFLQQSSFTASNFFRFHAKAISGNQQYVVLATQHDGIWVSTKSAQQFQTTPVTSRFNKVAGTLYTRSVLAEPQLNQVLAGSYFGDGLYRFNTATGAVETYPFLGTNGNKQTLIVNGIFRDHLGICWIASHENGILIFDENKKKLVAAASVYPALASVAANKIYCFYEDAAHHLYIATGDAGLVRLGANRELTRHYRHSPADSTSLLTDNLFAEKIFADRNGQLWLSTRSGISVLDPATNRFFHFVSSPNAWNAVPPAFWYSFQQDSKGNIYIGTGSGICRLAPGSRSLSGATYFSEKEGLIHHAVFSMVKDLQGMLWFTCRTGISCFNPANDSIRNFTYKNGLPAKTLMAPMQLASDGRIYHGAVDQFFSFDPVKILQQKEKAGVWLNAFKIFNRDSITGLTLNQVKQLTLTHTQNSFAFSFVAPILDYPDAMHYSWMLEGFDAGFTPGAATNHVTYTNLPPGNYIFRVRAAGINRAFASSEQQIQITIVPPFWQTGWFRFIALLLIAAMVYSFVKYREKRAAKNEAEKTALEKMKANSYQYQLEIEQVINYFASTINEQNSIDDLLWDVARNCISKLDFEDCVIYLVDAERQVLVQKAAWGPKTNEENKIIDPIEIPMGNGIVGSVAASGFAEVVDNTTADPRYIVDDAVRLSELTVPIMQDKIVMGIIDCEHSQPNFYTSRHVHIITTIASMLGDKMARMQAEQQTREKELQLLRLSKDLATWQITALRAQMNPHFIFNALNSIQQFILKQDADNANLYLSRFATLLRKVLHSSQQPLISLEEEVSQLELYLQLEKLRMGHRFTFSILVDESIEADALQVPGMLIQPFVENAIKHGLPLIEGEQRLTIEFTMPNDFHLQATITDNGIGRQKSAALKKQQTLMPHVSRGIGLVENRLHLMQQDKNQQPSVRIVDLPGGAGTRVILMIPFA